MVLEEDVVRCGKQLREIERHSNVDEMSQGRVFSGRSKQKLQISRFDEIGVKQCRCRIRHCIGRIYFEGQNFQDEEEVVGGDKGAIAGGVGFGEKAPGISFVMVAFADLRMDFRIFLHFD